MALQQNIKLQEADSIEESWRKIKWLNESNEKESQIQNARKSMTSVSLTATKANR